MSDPINHIENILRPHFQKEIIITIDNMEYKRGIFVLFQSTILSNNYYLEFHIKTNKKIDVLKIPYPFNIDNYEDEGLLYFDYRIFTMTKKTDLSKKLEEFAAKQEGFMQNKFYNKIIEIEFK